MTKRTLALCVVSVFTLLIMGSASQSQAGGFLQRLRSKTCSGRTIAWNRNCPPPVNSCQAIACSETPHPCTPSIATYSTPLSDLPPSSHETIGGNCLSTFVANCKKCDEIYAKDPTNRAKCKRVAAQLYCQCLKDPPTIKALSRTASPPLCACQYPEDPSGQTCLDAYEQESQSQIPGVRECAPACYFNCLNMIGQSNPDAKPPMPPVSQ